MDSCSLYTVVRVVQQCLAMIHMIKNRTELSLVHEGSLTQHARSNKPAHQGFSAIRARVQTHRKTSHTDACAPPDDVSVVPRILDGLHFDTLLPAWHMSLPAWRASATASNQIARGTGH